jgi:hypothetical protein
MHGDHISVDVTRLGAPSARSVDPAVPGLLAARLCRVSVVVLLAVRRSKLSGEGFSMSRVTGPPHSQKKSC